MSTEYDKMGCKVLMSGGQWQVPEAQRPIVPEPPLGLRFGQIERSGVSKELEYLAAELKQVDRCVQRDNNVSRKEQCRSQERCIRCGKPVDLGKSTMHCAKCRKLDNARCRIRYHKNKQVKQS